MSPAAGGGAAMRQQRRLFYALLGMTCLFGLLAAKLLWLQTAGKPFLLSSLSLGEASENQSERATVIDIGRAHFVDRNGARMTGEQRVDEVLLGGSIQSIENIERYFSGSAARHLIGYVAEQPDEVKARYSELIRRGVLDKHTPIGAAGLERSLDRLLLGIGPVRAVSYVDGRGYPLYGLGSRFVGPNSPYYPLNVVTSIDLKLQRKAEAALVDAGITEGAAVILHAETGDIVAMASVPGYSQQQVNPNDPAWRNRALELVEPGSIFKVAVAAAALESDAVKPNDSFECKGEWGAYGFRCWKHGGHGRITLREAFAHSCNIAFGEAMLRLPDGAIEQAADSLGLTRTVGWHTSRAIDGLPLQQLDGEQPGVLYNSEASHEDIGVRLQTAIGQRDVRISPLEASYMVAEIALGRLPPAPRAVRELRYANGRLKESFPSKEPSTRAVRLSGRTYRALREMMRATVTHGTGSILRELPLPAAGKSGTAETLHHGEKAIHQWFAGYVSTKQPGKHTFVIVVTAMNQPPDSPPVAAPVFGELVRVIHDDFFFFPEK